jgi:UDP-N-acetylglucosamine acyltransferase
MSSVIHPTAIVEPGAVLGEGCVIHAGAIIKAHAELGERCIVHPYAVVGGDPQVLKFDPNADTKLIVGARTIVREYVTLNRALIAGTATRIGSDNLFMACSHVGHDAVIENHCVIANSVLIAGHVHVSSYAILGGGSAYHQFSRVGEGAIIGGLARIRADVPPYVLAAEHSEVSGLNIVGLRRRGLPRETIRELKEAYREVYFHIGNIRELAAKALASGRYASAEAQKFLTFFTVGKRPICRPAKGLPAADSESDAE